MHFSVLLLQVIQDILLLGHRQAFAWIDDWIGKHVFVKLYFNLKKIFILKRLMPDKCKTMLISV